MITTYKKVKIKRTRFCPWRTKPLIFTAEKKKILNG